MIEPTLVWTEQWDPPSNDNIAEISSLFLPLMLHWPSWGKRLCTIPSTIQALSNGSKSSCQAKERGKSWWCLLSWWEELSIPSSLTLHVLLILPPDHQPSVSCYTPTGSWTWWLWLSSCWKGDQHQCQAMMERESRPQMDFSIGIPHWWVLIFLLHKLFEKLMYFCLFSDKRLALKSFSRSQSLPYPQDYNTTGIISSLVSSSISKY